MMSEMANGRMYGMNDAPTMNSPVDTDKVRAMAYVKMLMDNTGMDQKQAMAYVEENGLQSIIEMFNGGHETDELEEKFSTLKEWAEAAKSPKGFDPDLY